MSDVDADFESLSFLSIVMSNEIHCPVNFGYQIRMPRLIHFHAYRMSNGIHCLPYPIAKLNVIRYLVSLDDQTLMLNVIRYHVC
ncbi:hypothetical protein [Pediococcus acidilactici]|uniref:hypothetical protein n=1 Tax=Pediococcus acidilactici TaxID=1254 RepID=UPI0012DABD31|nr:hypothetical protein [Pediococcus acidilactici]